MFLTVLLIVFGVTAIVVPMVLAGFGAGYVSGRWKQLTQPVVKEIDVLIDTVSPQITATVQPHRGRPGRPKELKAPDNQD